MNPTRTESVSELPPLYRVRAVRWSLIGAGTVFVGLGILGVFLPLLPTTIFLLLAAWCYARSSERLYRWLHQNKIFGRQLKSYREGKGIAFSTKLSTLAILWVSIISSGLYSTESLLVRIILAVIGIGVTIHLLTIPTARREQHP